MQWYYSEAGQARGPCTQAVLLEFLRDGHITWDTHVIREGDGVWVKASDVQALRDGIGARHPTAIVPTPLAPATGPTPVLAVPVPQPRLARARQTTARQGGGGPSRRAPERTTRRFRSRSSSGGLWIALFACFGIAFLACAGLVIRGALSGFPPTGDWISHASNDGAYTALFPAPPEHSSGRQSTAVGDLTYHIDLYESTSAACNVGWVDYSQELIDGGDRDAMLDGAVDGAAGNVGGVVESRESGWFEGHPYRDARIRVLGANSLYIRARMILVGRRLYMVQALTKKAPGRESEFFINSFRLR